MRVMLTGARGLLGAAIAREFSGTADLHPFDRTRLELTDAGAVERTVADLRPDVIINCAAYNDVDGAESRPADALTTNAIAVLTLARAARTMNSVLVHYSTDFVFDGDAERPYTEEEPANPQSLYGLSKLLGEWFVLEYPNAYVLRVESLFGTPGRGEAPRGSLWGIIARIQAGDEVPVFVDRTVSPTYTEDAAAATRALVSAGGPPGLYHCVNSGAATWAEIATEVARLLDRPLGMKALTLAAAGLTAKRPRYCALSNEKLASVGIVMPEWRDAVGRYVRVLRGAEGF